MQAAASRSEVLDLQRYARISNVVVWSAEAAGSNVSATPTPALIEAMDSRSERASAPARKPHLRRPGLEHALTHAFVVK